MTNDHAPIEKKLFISHSSKDKNTIWPIIEELTAYGVGVWVDALEMRPGSKLFREISEGIGVSRYVAVMITSASVQSEWVKEEIQQAMSD
ncbi:toll/interleukin-1 receptor domain-containing protein [Chitinispirillales bacterium ANBcel5]|uniref:toll/interleukin-1 receptor domain-containing protein n=1 Tax=Cellulosispirillum alkaliphilum TaxID=3039283 RepID=UPI002A57576F|nr:toll/interleukin-1 receptor domain-containing protein [Chitinispirillales bacterium ANBcel5]